MTASPSPSRTQWRKSSHSGGTGNCVEVAGLPSAVGVRDSKVPDGAQLRLSVREWARVLEAIKAGRHDLA